MTEDTVDVRNTTELDSVIDKSCLLYSTRSTRNKESNEQCDMNKQWEGEGNSLHSEHYLIDWRG